MANNKHAHIRYTVLDKCFSNRFKKYFIVDLIEQCSLKLTDYYGKEASVSRRQIFDDISFMESEAGYSAPIEKYKDGKKVFYRYSEHEFSIFKKAISTRDEEQLRMTLETLNRMNQLPGFEWLHEVSTKLSVGLNLQQIPLEVMHFETNDFLRGIEHLSDLYHYIVNEQTILTNYKTFKADRADSFIISPYYLKQYNTRWFLFGWNHKVNLLQNLAVDRIQSITANKTSYKQSTVNFNEYFDDIIGVSNNSNFSLESIKIVLSETIIPYIKSKPLHGSQVIRGNILYLKVKLNYELESLILTYGENMIVQEPDILSKRLQERIKKLNDSYCAD